jgi:hypothetical protein
MPIVTYIQPGRLGNQNSISVRGRLIFSVSRMQTGSELYPAVYPMINVGISTGTKRPERDA